MNSETFLHFLNPYKFPATTEISIFHSPLLKSGVQTKIDQEEQLQENQEEVASVDAGSIPEWAQFMRISEQFRIDRDNERQLHIQTELEQQKLQTHVQMQLDEYSVTRNESELSKRLRIRLDTVFLTRRNQKPNPILWPCVPLSF